MLQKTGYLLLGASEVGDFKLEPITSLVAQIVKCLPTMQTIRVQSLGQEDLLEKEMAIHSSMLAGKIPWTEKPATVHGVAKSQTRLSDFTHSIFASG